jgi:hypothetical protein
VAGRLRREAVETPAGADSTRVLGAFHRTSGVWIGFAIQTASHPIIRFDSRCRIDEKATSFSFIEYHP